VDRAGFRQRGEFARVVGSVEQQRERARRLDRLRAEADLAADRFGCGVAAQVQDVAERDLGAEFGLVLGDRPLVREDRAGAVDEQLLAGGAERDAARVQAGRGERGAEADEQGRESGRQEQRDGCARPPPPGAPGRRGGFHRRRSPEAMCAGGLPCATDSRWASRSAPSRSSSRSRRRTLSKPRIASSPAIRTPRKAATVSVPREPPLTGPTCAGPSWRSVTRSRSGVLPSRWIPAM